MAKILFITLSNIGDVILTLPCLDYLREAFLGCKITVMAGLRAVEIFQNNIYIDRFIPYDKHAKLREKLRLLGELKKEKFDVVVDLRNSLFGVLLPARHKISPFSRIPKNIMHMKDRHLYKLQITNSKSQTENKSLYIRHEDEEYINNILKEGGVTQDDKIILIAPGARSHTKRWPREKFTQLVQCLEKESSCCIILAGDNDDMAISKYICENSKAKVLDLGGKTTITQLAALIKKSHLIITNDSATLHLASY
ncbi:MAG: glycosyltransferase family 9 protein, partial [Candidatus Omnitrophota bacterium]